MKIHSTAIVSPDSYIGEGVEIGPYSVVGRDVRIGNNTAVASHVVIEDGSYIGENCQISQFSCIGGIPQDLKFSGEETRVVIGNYNNIREFVTINRATREDLGVTAIGGLTGIHQFTRLGAHCMIGGASAVNRDVPPFVTVSGNHARLYGLNLIGMKRRGFKEETIKALKDAYRTIFRSGMLLNRAIEIVKKKGDIPEVRHFLEFIQASKRGVC